MISERSITRSIASLGFQLQGDMHRKEKEGRPSRLAETDQQFQVKVSGEATPIAEWTEVVLTFDETIYVAPAQRNNPLEEPHFTFGSSMQSDSPVMLHATVQRWVTDASGNFTGAVVNLGVTGGSEEGGVRFKGTAHLTFQGLSAPNYPATGTGEG